MLSVNNKLFLVNYRYFEPTTKTRLTTEQREKRVAAPRNIALIRSMTEKKKKRSSQQSSTADRKRKDEMAKADLMRRLDETGERERLKRKLRARLIECGWREEMKDLCRDAIRSKGGVTQITVDELVGELLPRGRSAVPEDVKGDLVANIRDFARRQQQQEQKSETNK